jgi:hypothetical protein
VPRSTAGAAAWEGHGSFTAVVVAYEDVTAYSLKLNCGSGLMPMVDPLFKLTNFKLQTVISNYSGGGFCTSTEFWLCF